MPGKVEANVTYSVTKSRWNIKMMAVSPEAKTRMWATCPNLLGSTIQVLSEFDPVAIPKDGS